MPNSTLEVLLIALGPIAVWRYGWWMLHVLRAIVYARCVFPPLRRRADELWASGWRPPVVHFVMTTFKEKPEVTRAVLASIFDECRSCAAPSNIIIGTGDSADERVIEAFCAEVENAPAKVTLVRQTQPGKRIAIGLALRALSRHGVAPEDVVVLMDGDSILCPGVVEKCAPLFALRPQLGAVTTNEAAIVNGPRWMQTWLELRFAQRRIAMQSHSLSRKVLTLTGRLSVYRAPLVVEEEFIRMVEADYLDHWLWGRFRFLSGDDKSTWYTLLRRGLEMLYVPDAAAVTVENVESQPWERAKQNLLRWSGNMLRNGSRALALGPRRCGWFIWWCVLDQRLAIAASLAGPALALMLSLADGFAVLAAYLIWVLLTRTIASLVIALYAKRFSPLFPILLFANQVAGACVKVYLLFRMSKQRWANRGDQRAPACDMRLIRLQNGLANLLTLLYCSVFVLLLSVMAGARWLHWLAWAR